MVNFIKFIQIILLLFCINNFCYCNELKNEFSPKISILINNSFHYYEFAFPRIFPSQISSENLHNMLFLGTKMQIYPVNLMSQTKSLSSPLYISIGYLTNNLSSYFVKITNLEFDVGYEFDFDDIILSFNFGSNYNWTYISHYEYKSEGIGFHCGAKYDKIFSGDKLLFIWNTYYEKVIGLEFNFYTKNQFMSKKGIFFDNFFNQDISKSVIYQYPLGWSISINLGLRL